jgi:hypothetical protein
MCLIISKEEGQDLVNNTMLEEIWDKNPHGAGIVFRKKGSSRFKMRKGYMTLQDLKNAIRSYGLTSEDYIAYHFRYATSGDTDKRGTHPFVVHEDAKAVSATRVTATDKTTFVFHNGVIYDLNDRKSNVSDTQRFVNHYLTEISTEDLFNNPVIQELIEKFIDGSRLLLINNKFGVKFYGSWHKHEDYLISKDYDEATGKDAIKNHFGSAWENESHDYYWDDWNDWDESDTYTSEVATELEFCDYCCKSEKSKYVQRHEAYLCNECLNKINECYE